MVLRQAMSISSLAADEFLALTENFNRRAAELGLGDVSRYYWYHTIDLGDGLVTPGLYDYRETIGAFRFPADLHGKRVLDVGSATGYFAFEFARRGATVVSVELPSLEQLDRFPGQDTENLLWKIERMIVPHEEERLQALRRRYTSEELWQYLLDGPFRFCQQRLGLPIQRCFSSAYDLTPHNTYGGNFDLVFIGDVLVHTLYPLKALAAASALCRGTLVLAQLMPEPADGQTPAMVYVGGDDPQEDHVSWWEPNKPCFVQMLKKLGFRIVEDAGHHTGVLRPAGFRFDRTILHATR